MTVISMGKQSLAIQQLNRVEQPEAVIPPVDHIVAIDVSGSMYSDLPELRLQLKNKLSSLVAANDTVTIIWFSGRGQYGVLVEALEIHSLRELTALHTAIDRYLQPQGLTGFKEPLEEVLNVIARIGKRRHDSLFSLFFMTDGYDNQWTNKDILAVCKALERKLSNATIVEYGWNCNRPLLTKMAEAMGANLIFNRDFQEYQATFEAELSRGNAAKKVPVTLLHTPSFGYVFAAHEGSVLTFVPDEDNVVFVPEGVEALGYYVDGPGEKFNHKKHSVSLLWVGLATLSQRMGSDAIFDVLATLGDIALVDVFSSCFSKEDYVLFQEDVLRLAHDPEWRYSRGYSANAVPKEDAYTVLEMIGDLASSDQNLFYPRHEAFAYERIGATSEAKEEGIRFTYGGSKLQGYPINGIVWNEDRPNVSVRVRAEGFVKLPADRPAGLPENFPTYVYRNYTVVRDGIVHTRKLPVSLSRTTFDKLQANGLLAGESWAEGKIFVLDYPKLPVINRRMVQSVTAQETFNKVLRLQLLKGTQKVLNEFRDRYIPKESKVFQVVYDAEDVQYLKDRGITDYNGFNPSSTSAKSGDVYQAFELKIAVKGLSSLPKVSEVEAALVAKKRLKVSEFVMTQALEKVNEFLTSSLYIKAADQKALLGTWLESEAKAVVAQTRQLMQELAQDKFSIVVGHTWFKDMPSMDDNSLEVELPGYGAVAVTATLKETQIEV